MRSATTRPPLASRFARIRSASTSRPVDGVRGGRCRATGECERAGERLPLGVPAADRALVLVSEAAEQDSRVRVREARTRDRERRADGIALLRHRRGPSARRLCDLAHLALREEHDVAADLRGRARRAVQRRAELRDALAVRVPGEHGLREPELLCVERGRSRAPRLRARRGFRQRRRAAPRAARRGRRRVCRAPRARRRASRPPSGRTSSAPPAGGACAPPSASSGGRGRAPRIRRRAGRAPRARARRRGARRASRPCRRCPGWSRPRWT